MVRWGERVAALKRETVVLALAFSDSRTPWYAKALLALVIAYAASPIDLIPDFIPVVGLLDDLLLIPAGLYLALKLVPRDLVREYRELSEGQPIPKRFRTAGAVIVVLAWSVAIALVVFRVFRR